MRANKFCRVDKETDLIAMEMYQQGKSLTVIAKELGLDAIHDTVHEMAKDEARHGKGFDGLLKRYFS